MRGDPGILPLYQGRGFYHFTKLTTIKLFNLLPRLIGRMLVRDPGQRATLAEIAADPWLSPALQDDPDVPLVSRETVSEEDHNFIVTKMVNGKIASKEDILE